MDTKMDESGISTHPQTLPRPRKTSNPKPKDCLANQRNGRNFQISKETSSNSDATRKTNNSMKPKLFAVHKLHGNPPFAKCMASGPHGSSCLFALGFPNFTRTLM
jgi:hypothetical protein